MSDYAGFVLDFKMGVLKELRKRELLTKEALEKVIKTIKS
jgi:hypothetical protein